MTRIEYLSLVNIDHCKCYNIVQMFKILDNDKSGIHNKVMSKVKKLMTRVKSINIEPL